MVAVSRIADHSVQIGDRALAVVVIDIATQESQVGYRVALFPGGLRPGETTVHFHTVHQLEDGRALCPGSMFACLYPDLIAVYGPAQSSLQSACVRPGTAIPVPRCEHLDITYPCRADGLGRGKEEQAGKDRQYEKNALKIMSAQNRLNWETRLEIPQTIVRNSSDVYRFSAVDSRGLPIQGAQVKVFAYRPSDAGADFVTPLQEIAPGLYQADIGFPLQGVWDLQVKAQRAEEVYQMSYRVSVLQAVLRR